MRLVIRWGIFCQKSSAQMWVGTQIWILRVDQQVHHQQSTIIYNYNAFQPKNSFHPKNNPNILTFIFIWKELKYWCICSNFIMVMGNYFIILTQKIFQQVVMTMAMNQTKIGKVCDVLGRIRERSLRRAFCKFVIYEKEDGDNDIPIIHYDRHKQGITNIIQIFQNKSRNSVLRGFYTIKNHCKKTVINSSMEMGTGHKFYRKQDFPTSESLTHNMLRKNRVTFTLGSKRKSYTNLLEKHIAVKSPKYQYRSQFQFVN